MQKINWWLIKKKYILQSAELYATLLQASRVICIDSTKASMNRLYIRMLFLVDSSNLHSDMDRLDDLFIQTGVINIRVDSHQQMSHDYGSSVFFDGTIEGPIVTDGRYYCCTCKRWSRDLLLDGILTHLSHSQRKFLNGRYTRLRSSHLHVAPPPSSRLPPRGRWTCQCIFHRAIPIESCYFYRWERQ